MVIHLNNINKNNEKRNTKLHWMPCVIKSNGEANVSKYFESIITKSKSGALQASFRGYPLLGKEINVPKNYTGVVLKQINERVNEEAGRDLYGIHVFDKFTYWNWDLEPSENDPIIGALEWLEVSKAVSEIFPLAALYQFN